MKNLIKNSFVFLTGSLAAGFGGYLFQVLMGRLLSLKEYGELGALLSLSLIFSVPTAAISFAAVKYTSSYQAKGKTKEIWDLFSLFTKKLMTGGFILFIVFISFSPFLLKFLNMDSIVPLFILGIFIWFGFLIAVSKSILQGVQNFKHLSLTSIFEVFLKTALAVALVMLGFGLGGVIGAMLAASVAGYAFSLIPFKRFKRQTRKPWKFLFFSSSGGYLRLNVKKFLDFKNLNQGIRNYITVSFFTLLAFTLLYNADMVLVKHFFNADQAGAYGALSVMGKIIFFVLSPIAAVMLPMISGAGEGKKKNILLKNSFFLTLGIGSAILASYKFFPELIVKTLFGEKYFSITPYLFWYGLAMFGVAVINLLLTYLLFFEKKFGAVAVGSGVVLQMVLIYFFHQNFAQIIFSIIGSLIWVIVAFAVYFAIFFKPKVLSVEV